VRAVRHTGEKQMPPGKKLVQRDIDTLVKWIKLGAPWKQQGPQRSDRLDHTELLRGDLMR
jgi:hypothetical protein